MSSTAKNTDPANASSSPPSVTCMELRPTKRRLIRFGDNSTPLSIQLRAIASPDDSPLLLADPLFWVETAGPTLRKLLWTSISRDDFPTLRAVLHDFADTHGLQVCFLGRKLETELWKPGGTRGYYLHGGLRPTLFGLVEACLNVKHAGAKGPNPNGGAVECIRGLLQIGLYTQGQLLRAIMVYLSLSDDRRHGRREAFNLVRSASGLVRCDPDACGVGTIVRVTGRPHYADSRSVVPPEGTFALITEIRDRYSGTKVAYQQYYLYIPGFFPPSETVANCYESDAFIAIYAPYAPPPPRDDAQSTCAPRSTISSVPEGE